MISATVKVDGHPPKLSDATIKRLGARAAQRALSEASREALPVVKRRQPVRTGALRSSIAARGRVTISNSRATVRMVIQPDRKHTKTAMILEHGRKKPTRAGRTKRGKPLRGFPVAAGTFRYSIGPVKARPIWASIRKDAATIEFRHMERGAQDWVQSMERSAA